MVPDRLNHIYLSEEVALEINSTPRMKTYAKESLERHQSEVSEGLLIQSTTTWRAMTSQPQGHTGSNMVPHLITRMFSLDSAIT